MSAGLCVAVIRRSVHRFVLAGKAGEEDAAQKCYGENRNDDERGRDIHDQNPQLKPSMLAARKPILPIQNVPRRTFRLRHG